MRIEANIAWAIGFGLVSLHFGCGGDDEAGGASVGGDAALADASGRGDSALTDAVPDASVEADAVVAAPQRPIEIAAGGFVFDAIAAGPADGTPVILLHGFSQTSHAFRRQVAALGEAGFRAVAPDQRGYSPGARPANVEDYALPLLAQDVLDMADALGFERFHLVGHDWGAAVTWYLGATRADRLLTLTSASVPHLDAFAQALADPGSDQRRRSSYFAFFSRNNSEDAFLANDATLLRGVYDGVDEADVEAYVTALGTKEALRAALNWYRANDLASAPGLAPIHTPTMFIWGDADDAVGPDAAHLTEDFVDGPYRFEIIEGGTHWLLDTSSDEITTLLLDFLAR